MKLAGIEPQAPPAPPPAAAPVAAETPFADLLAAAKRREATLPSRDESQGDAAEHAAAPEHRQPPSTSTAAPATPPAAVALPAAATAGPPRRDGTPTGTDSPPAAAVGATAPAGRPGKPVAPLALAALSGLPGAAHGAAATPSPSPAVAASAAPPDPTAAAAAAALPVPVAATTGTPAPGPDGPAADPNADSGGPAGPPPAAPALPTPAPPPVALAAALPPAAAGKGKPSGGDSIFAATGSDAAAGQSTAAPLLPDLAATASGAAAAPGQAIAGRLAATPAPLPATPATQVAVALLRGIGADAVNSFVLQLRPERLGTVAVTLEVDAKGKATASFAADHPATLQMLRQDAHELVRALNAAGVQADAGSLNFSLRDAGGSFAEARSQWGAHGPGDRSGSLQQSAAIEAAPIRRSAGTSRLYDIQA